MKFIAIFFLLTSTCFAQSSYLQLENKNIISNNDLSSLLYYQDAETESCFVGNETELVSDINADKFSDVDWGLSEATVISSEQIHFVFWSLGGRNNAFTVNRCPKNDL